jgi:hypothetical protein
MTWRSLRWKSPCWTSNKLICFGAARERTKRIRSLAAGRDREHGGAIARDRPGISQAAQPRAFNGGLRMLDARAELLLRDLTASGLVEWIRAMSMRSSVTQASTTASGS